MQVLQCHNGSDIGTVFAGLQEGHQHSESAYSLLETFCVGVLETRTGRIIEAPGSTKTLGVFPIDESKPLIEQVGGLGKTYNGWVYNPVPGQPRFFHTDLAESFTKVQWWVVPLLWLPLLFWSFVRAFSDLNLEILITITLAGVVAWQAMEYSLHRWFFHKRPTTRKGIVLHFLLHGCHHKFPMDTDRLVFPPLPASLVIAPIWFALHAVLSKGAASAFFGGMLGGYITYDCCHYLMHSGCLGGTLAQAHMGHHFNFHDAGFGISSPLFDWIFHTSRKSKSA